MGMSFLDYKVKHRQHQKERGEDQPSANAAGKQASKSSPASSGASKKTGSGTSFLDYKVNKRKEQVNQNGYERYGTYTSAPRQASQGPQTAAPMSQDNPYMKAAVRQTLPAYQRPVDPITAAAANMLRNNAKGNINLYSRPQYRQPDGSISTVNSISIGTDEGAIPSVNGKGMEVLIPTIGRDKNGRPVQWTDDQAIDHYYKTGENLGKFNSIEDADRYAEKLHQQQEAYYSPENSPLRLNNVIPKPYEIGEGIQRFESGGQLHQNDPEADKYIEKSIRTTKNPFANSGINSTIDPQTGDVTYTAEHGRNNWLNDYNVQENLESDEARKARADALNLLIARGRGDDRSRYESTVLQNMNEDEQKEYSYLLGKFGREQAEKYLDRIGEQVTNRRAAEIVENVNRDVVPDEGNIPTSYVNPRTGEVIENARSGKNPVNSLARAGKMGKLAAQSGLDMFVSGVGDKFTNYVTGGTETTPATAEARASQAVKEQLNPLGRLAYDVVENEAMMLPTQAATVAAALLFPPLAPAAASVGTGASIGTLAAAKAAADAPQIFGIGTTMFPMSAGQAYEEGLQKGLTPDQARFYGTLEGLNQAGLEYALGGFEDLSGGFAKQAVDNVLGNVVADETKSQAAQTVARAVQHFLTTPEGRMAFSMGSEAFEEIVQGSVSNALNNAFFGENNGPVSQEDLYSGLVAALSAGMSNARYYAGRYANGVGRVYSAEDIRAAADNIITDRAAYVNQEAYDAAMEQRDQMLAQADYVEQGGNLTPLERGELGEAAGGALAEMDRIGRRARNESDIQEVTDALKTAQEIAQTEETKQEVEKISTRANDIIKRRAEGAQVTDAEVGRLINDTIKTTLTAGNEKAAATAEARTRMGFGEQGNTVMESSQATGQKAEALTALYEEARYDIKRNDAQKQLASTLLSEQELSAMYQAGIQDRNAFYNTDYSDKIGKIAEKYRPGNIKRGNVTYDGVDMDALQKAGDNESRAKYAQMKTIEHFLAGTLGYNVEWFESKTADGKYEGENGSYNRAKHLIRLDINAGAEVIGDKVKFASVIAHELTHTIEDGSPMQYQKIANTVMKALVADQEYSRGRNAEQIVADMIENNPYVKNEADAIHELVAQACEDMMNGNADIRAMFEGMSESERNTIFDHISNIFAAIKNFFDDLLNSDAVRSNRTEAAAIRRAKENIESLEKEWTEGVKRAAAYNAAAYEESQRQAAEQAKENQEQTEEQTSENEQMGNAFGDETGRITKDADGNVVIAESEDGQSMVCSLRTLPTTQAKLAEVLKRKGYSEESIKAAQDQVGTVADMLTRVSTYYAEMAEALDAELLVDPKTGKTVLHSFVTNGDYPVNIDFLTICKKREAYMHVLTDLIDHGIFDKVAFDGAAIATTNEILRDAGFETACACCFVESRRLQIQRWAETFCSEWNEEVLKRNPNATPFNFSKGDRGANSLTQDELIELDKELRSLTKKEKNDKGNYKIRQQGARAKMGPLLDRIPALGHTLSVGDLITPNGIDSMRTLDSNLFSLVKQRYGTATPKIAQAFSPYNGDVADLNYGFMRTEIKENITGSKKYKAEAKSALIKEGIKKPNTQQIEDRAIRKYLYDIGGVRLQSFSDFLIENTLDYFQMFADLAAKELPLHAYSKEISFIKIFGMTGGKLNMSLIPIVDLNTDRDHAGLKKNKDGTYSYAGWGDYEHHLMIDNRSFIQSIGFKDAIALQLHPGYSSHVGTIAIGISDEHIRMMLNDPLIRMVIPYHSSGMLPEFAKQMHIDYYHDYTKTQNTTLGRCTDVDGNEVPVYNLKGNDSYSCDTHFDFNEAFQRLGDARMACEEYKEWCKQQHPVYYKNKQVGWAEFTPKFVEFAKERNYYKLIEDFNSYDCITEESAIQGAVRMSFPGMEENLLNDEELKAYEERLRATGQFTEKEIQKYVSRANETLEEIVTREAKNRNAYHREMDKKYDSTLKKIEDKLQKNFNKTDYVLKDNKYVRKSGEQKSSRDTAARVGSAGEQFSMRGTAEETKNLIAVHNLNEQKMKGLIKLSGFPAPSIAITRASDGWNKFGEISFVYDKDSIDPKRNRKNKIYGADAWTPTFPTIEYEIDRKVVHNAYDKVSKIADGMIPDQQYREALNRISSMGDKLSRNTVEEVAQDAWYNLAVKAAYVASKGIKVEDVQKSTAPEFTSDQIAGYNQLRDELGDNFDDLLKLSSYEVRNKYGDALERAYYKIHENDEKKRPKLKEGPIKDRVLTNVAKKAVEYIYRDTGSNQTVQDTESIEKFVNENADREGFEKWIKSLYDGAVIGPGISNGKDRYFSDGRRRSWKQTHVPVTAENILKNMMRGSKTGSDSIFTTNSFIAVAQDSFKSIADVKRSEGRLQELDDSEFSAATRAIGEKLSEIEKEIIDRSESNQLFAMDQVGAAITEAIRKYRTVEGIDKELRKWGDLNIREDTAQKVLDLSKEAASIPTKYFEAKPERVVGFDEVRAAIVPADVAPEIREWLNKQGINTVTYERDNDADRTRALNSVENVRFSSRNSTRQMPQDLTDKQQKNYQFNQKQTEIGSTLKTLNGSRIERSKYGVGKDIGGQYYVHKDYAEEIVPGEALTQAKEILGDAYPDFKYNAIMYQPSKNVVRFDEAPDFDTAREPMVGTTVTVYLDNGSTKLTKGKAYNKYIWHHKWQWVRDDYDGFDVGESWNWSKQWLSTLTETSDGNGIGRWNAQLDKFGLPHDGEEQYSSRLTRGQKYTGEDTSVLQIPGTFTHFEFPAGTRILDYGGGQFNFAKDAVEKTYPGVSVEVMDAFNRTSKHNDRISNEFDENKADAVTVNNVLNVIDSRDARIGVIEQAKRYLKHDGVAYFLMYQADKNAESGEAKGSQKDESRRNYQTNMDQRAYIPEIKEVFDYVTEVRSGGDIYLLASNIPLTKDMYKLSDQNSPQVKYLRSIKGDKEEKAKYNTLSQRYGEATVEILDTEYENAANAVLKNGEIGDTATIKKIVDHLAVREGLDKKTVRDLYKIKRDANGNVIPLSQRVEIHDENIRYSSRDNSYMKAVESNDMETASRLVEEAAKKAGYTLKVYHGTGARFNVFNKWHADYFSPSREYAEQYDENVMSIYLKPGNVFDTANNKKAREIYNNEFLPYAVKKEWMSQAEANNKRVKAGEDADFTVADDLFSFLKSYNRKNGNTFDAIKIFENGGFVVGDETADIAYVPLDNKLVKLADPVTYDSRGNVIPLSERFNPANEDIRYSSRSNGFDQRTSFGTVEELERRNENIWHINYTLDQALRDRGAQTQKVSDYQIKRIANRFIREYNSKADADTIAEGLKAMYEYIDYGAKISAQQVGKIATAYAEQIIDESKDVDDTMAAMYPGLADDIKRTKLYVSPEAMKEMAYYFDGAADFRRQAKKFLTISERPGDGRGIDTFYEELSESYPELFDPDVANEKDQLLQIFDVAERLKAKTIDKDWGSEYDEVAYTLGQDLVAAYFAEKGDSSYKRSIDQIKVQMAKDHKEQMANLRRYKDQQIKEIKDKLTGERRMNTAQIAELRARLQEQYRQREEKASLRRLTTQAKAKLQRQARQLWSKRGTPEFERLKAKLFSELDLVSVGITKGGRLSLEKTYNEARKQAMLDPDYATSADYENIKLMFQGDPANPSVERKHLRDLSYDEIVDLTQDIIALKHSQQTYDKVIKENYEAKVADYGRRGVAQQGRVKGILNQKGRRATMLAAVKKYALYMENPVRAAHLLDGYQEGGVLTELFDDINDGTTKKTKFQQQANQMFEEILKDKKLTDGWSDQNIEINVGAGKYYISKGMRISIALHAQNDDNIRHVSYGGFNIPNERLYKAGRYTDAYNAGTQVQMTEEEMKQIASEMTPEEKKFAAIAHQFFNHTTKDAINETSMVLKGYELAVVPNYMPIRTDPNFTQAEIDGLIHDGTIEGKGQFKDRKPGASNPILLEDIAQVIERQTQTTAAYCGLAIPVRNMNKVWKYTATAYKASMKDAIAKNWGQLGKDTIEKMIKDIQAGARRGDTGDHVFSFLKGAQAASTLTMNVGVSMKQFASYPLAISMLDADCLMKGLRAKTDRAYIDSITPWSWDRRHGMGGEEMGDIFKQKGMIARNENIQKIKNMVNWIQAVDVFTTDHLFAACEAQVQKDNPDLEVRGKEYNEKVAALYNDVLWRTQPSYGVMQRNELMRSASSIMKALTMYKTQTFNMGGEIIDAGLRAITMKDMAKDGLVSNDEAKKARQDLKKVLWGTVLSQATLAALSAIAAAALRKMKPYRDDKGEITASSLMQKAGTDFVTSWFGLFFGADLAEQAVGSVLNFAQWYDVTAPQLNGLNDTVSDMSAWSTALGDYIGETDADKKTEKKAKLVKTSAKMAMTTAGTFGVPTTNVYNMLNALNLLAQDVSEGNGFLSFEAGKGLLGLTDTSPTKEQYARQAVYYSERDDADKVAHALQGTNKSNLEKVLGMKLTKNLYDSFMNDPENLAKYLNVKQGVSAPKPSDVPDEGYASFTKLREAIGDPERTQNWHHIVEQEQGPGNGNFGNFSAMQINNKNNIVSIPSGAKSPHSAISKYYDSVQDFTGGKTVREWLSTKSFEEQFDFGVKQLQKYGDIIPTGNGWVFVPDDQKIEAAMPLEKGKADVRTDTQKQWETRMAELREDGGLTGREVRDAALTMLKDGLTADEAIELYRSNQKSDKNLDKWKGGFEDYLNSRNAIDDAKAIKDSDKKRQKEKRKQAVEDYLRQYHGTREDELLLWKLAGYGESTFEYH